MPLDHGCWLDPGPVWRIGTNGNGAATQQTPFGSNATSAWLTERLAAAPVPTILNRLWTLLGHRFAVWLQLEPRTDDDKYGQTEKRCHNQIVTWC